MENAHDQRTLKHTLLYHESHWVHPVTSVSTIGLLKQAQSLWGPTVLPPSQTGLFISYHLLSCSSLKRSFSFPPSACLHPFPPQPLPSHRPPLFSPPPFIIFFLPPPLSHLSPSLPRPLSSVPAGYSPDLDFHFPPLSHSYPLFLAEASGPWLAFCPPAFITPFLFFPWLSPHCVFTACYLGDFKEA